MIYADNAATTKLSDAAFKNMLPFLQEQYGNASSQHSYGVKARSAIKNARDQIAQALGAHPEEIIFTSGGSEANSWVMCGIAEAFAGQDIHIITSAVEHPSILNACYALERKGVTISYLPVDRFGLVSLDDVKNTIRPNTKLVSIMLANNEIGTIQPISEIGRYLRNINIMFHSDAVQAVGHILVDVNDLQVDFLSASAHKFNGPKGTGFLYQRSGLEIPPIIFGGEQEYGARPGTENVAGIVATGYALEESIQEMKNTARQVRHLINTTVKTIYSQIPHVTIHGGDPRLPGIINLGFNGVTGEALTALLDLKGICVSSGSACTSGMNIPSHVLLAIGLSTATAQSAVRISYGRFNTEEEATTLGAAICAAYTKIIDAKDLGGEDIPRD